MRYGQHTHNPCKNGTSLLALHQREKNSDVNVNFKTEKTFTVLSHYSYLETKNLKNPKTLFYKVKFLELHLRDLLASSNII